MREDVIDQRMHNEGTKKRMRFEVNKCSVEFYYLHHLNNYLHVIYVSHLF